MFVLGRLLSLVAVERSLPDASVIQQFLVRAGACLAMAITGAMLVGALLVCGLFVMYQSLMTYGLTPEAALLFVVGVVILLLVILMLAMTVQFHKLQHMAHRLIRRQSPISGITDTVTDMADAFMRGLKQPSQNTAKPAKQQY